MRHALRAGRLDYLNHPYGSVFASIGTSVAALDDTATARYVELAVFPDDAFRRRQAEHEPYPTDVIALKVVVSSHDATFPKQIWG